MKTKIAFPTLVLTIALACTASASAATRYASPSGTGAPATCSQAAPCSLDDVLDYTFVHDGDEIVVGPGTYVQSGDLASDKAIWLHGAAGEPRPLIDFSSGGLYLDDDGLKVSDLAIHSTSTQRALMIPRGVAERVEVRSEDSTACSVAWTTMRDSVCLSDDSPALTSGYANPYTYTIHLRNVTAVALGHTLPVNAINIDGDQGNKITLDAKNVLAYAANPAGHDVYVSAGRSGATTDAVFEGSNYDDIFVGNNSTATAAGAGSNRTAAPVFTNLAAGDVTPAAGSPTIDAGVEDVSNGVTDVSGGARVVGTAIDTGAYEFVPAPPAEDPPADSPVDAPAPAALPQTTITKAPRARTHRRHALIRFESDTASARFECSVDGGDFSACSSPLSVRLKRGRHTIAVRAVTPTGKVDGSPATAKFRIVRRSRVL